MKDPQNFVIFLRVADTSWETLVYRNDHHSYNFISLELIISK